MKPRIGALSAALTVLVIALSACVPNPGPTLAPPEPAVTPTPTATDPPPDPSELVLGPDGFVVIDGDGDVTFEFAWADDPAPAVAELEILFGAAPEVTIAPADQGSPHYAAFDTYRWEGLSFAVAQLDRPRDEYFLPSFVGFTSNESHGVRLTSRIGVAVGDDMAPVLALVPPPQSISFASDEGTTVYYYADFSTDPVFSRAVLFDPTLDGSAVERIFAPRSPEDP